MVIILFRHQALAYFRLSHTFRGWEICRTQAKDDRLFSWTVYLTNVTLCFACVCVLFVFHVFIILNLQSFDFALTLSSISAFTKLFLRFLK